MLSSIQPHPFIEENITISNGIKSNQENKNINKIPIIRQNKEKNDIIIDLSQKNRPKKEDDEKSTNSSDFSSQMLKQENKVKYKAKTERKNPKFRSKKEYERYTERIKERTMRLELEKISKETERFAKEYEERNSYKYIFDNNPQFQKLLKSVQNQLILIFIISIFVFIMNSIVYFNLTHKKFGISLANMALAVSDIAIIIVLIISLKIGLLNDPNLSKAIRLFILIEFILQMATCVINILIMFLINDYLKKVSYFGKIIIYILFSLIILLTIFSFKYCFTLFFESLLILLNKKTEYAILMINEKSNKSNNINLDLSISNNISTLGLNQTESNLITENEKQIKTDKNENDEKYRNYNYFNRFHYSVTSARKEPVYFNKL